MALNSDGTLRTVAGTGRPRAAGDEVMDGTSAIVADLDDPQHLAVGPDGSLYFQDRYRIRRVNGEGILAIIAGNGVAGYDADGHPATAFRVLATGAMAFASDGSLVVPNRFRLRSLTAGSGGPPAVSAILNAASFRENVAVGSIAIAKGTALAPSHAPQASGGAFESPLPAELLGTRVDVVDARGQTHMAGLYSVAPREIRFQVPPASAAGMATATVRTGQSSSQPHAFALERIAPGLFSANGDGQGVAAGEVVTRMADGSMQTGPLAQYRAASHRYEPVPVDLDVAARETHLRLYGTGMSGGAAVTAEIGGASVLVATVQSLPEAPGMELLQIGPLPQGVLIDGEHQVVVHVEGSASNPVTVLLGAPVSGPVSPLGPRVGVPLEAGAPRAVHLLARDTGVLQNGARSFLVSVPPDATELTLTFVADDPSAEVLLYARHEAPIVTIDDAHWSAVTSVGRAEIQIGAGTDPALRSGTIYVSLLLRSASGRALSGTLLAELGMGGGPPSGFLNMEFVSVPAGEFVMGWDGGNEFNDERPLTRVTLTRGFDMGKSEVTQAQWEAVMGENPSHFKDCGSECPVESVSWLDVQGFIERLNLLDDGWTYRLPTEAEWEYAARSGVSGDEARRYGPLDEIAWCYGNGGRRTQPVAQKPPNAWGFHDIIGNVSEWVSDSYYRYPGGSVTDPDGAEPSPTKIVRGGSWTTYPFSCTASDRIRHGEDWIYNFNGLRLVRTR